MSDTCRGCPAKIFWVKTAAGKTMPLDEAPTTSDDTKVVLYDQDGNRLLAPAGILRTGHVPHWAACPARAQFKRRP
jgi:hypothetical protein